MHEFCILLFKNTIFGSLIVGCVWDCIFERPNPPKSRPGASKSSPRALKRSSKVHSEFDPALFWPPKMFGMFWGSRACHTLVHVFTIAFVGLFFYKKDSLPISVVACIRFAFAATRHHKVLNDSVVVFAEDMASYEPMPSFCKRQGVAHIVFAFEFSSVSISLHLSPATTPLDSTLSASKSECLPPFAQ